MRFKPTAGNWPLIVGMFIVVSASNDSPAATLQTLASFDGINGISPSGGLLADASGNLYGTASNDAGGRGTIFKLDRSTGNLTALATFNNNLGLGPNSGVTPDAAGNLYGTADYSGPGTGGTVFKLAAGTGGLTRLVAFNGGNGANPLGGLVYDGAGNLYGTTVYGGQNDNGTVFRVSAANGALATLVEFSGANGSRPSGGVIADAAGNLYGTTTYGGASGNGTLFRIDLATGNLTTLVTFNASTGPNPESPLIADSAGNLYGTTFGGGTSHLGDGTIFKFNTLTGTLTTLASFDRANGIQPGSQNLLIDAAGNLFGTTFGGGANFHGVVYELAAGSNTIKALVSLDSNTGIEPQGGLVADAAGNLYGTTSRGGSHNYGTIFELTGTGFVVPEPSSLGLLGIAVAALRLRRHRPR